MSINKYIKEKENIDITYQMFKDKNDINLKEELFLNNKNKQNIFKSKPFKLSISLTILLLVISLSIIGVNYINNNKYNHYKLYEKGDDLNEIINKISVNSEQEDVGPNDGTERFITEISRELIYGGEFVYLDIKSSSTKYLYCAYVSKEIETKIIEAYNWSLYYNHDRFSSVFYNDSLFNAYVIASNMGPYYKNIYNKIKIDRYQYPISWYIVKDGEKVYDTIDDKFLIGVLECKELIATGFITGKQEKYPIYFENYDYINKSYKQLKKNEFVSDKKEYRTWTYKQERMSENDHYIEYLGWGAPIFIFSSMKICFEKEIHYGRVSKVENIEGEEYINVGRKTNLINYGYENYTFNDLAYCLFNHNNRKCPDECIPQRGKIINKKYIDLKDLYSYKTKYIEYEENVKNLEKDNCIEYLFKIKDILNFLDLYRNYDIETYPRFNN